MLQPAVDVVSRKTAPGSQHPCAGRRFISNTDVFHAQCIQNGACKQHASVLCSPVVRGSVYLERTGAKMCDSLVTLSICACNKLH